MSDKKKNISYSKRMSTKKYYVLLEKTDVLGVFTTLKKACDFMKEEKFPSYWTLVRQENNTFKDDKFKHGNYSLQIVKHGK